MEDHQLWGYLIVVGIKVLIVVACVCCCKACVSYCCRKDEEEDRYFHSGQRNINRRLPDHDQNRTVYAIEQGQFGSPQFSDPPPPYPGHYPATPPPPFPAAPPFKVHYEQRTPAHQV